MPIFIDDNRSLWAAAASHRPPRPPLAERLEVDVAVIGGGFTGMSTAYHLARRHPELRVVVLEAKRIANGGSGRNGGLMLNWVNGVEPGDPARAAGIWRATNEGIDLVEGIIREHDLKVRWRRTGNYSVHTRLRGAEVAAREVEGLRAEGLPLQFLDGSALPAHLRMQGAVGATFDPCSGHLDGVSYLEALLPVVEGLGVQVFEGSPVERIEEGASCTLHVGAYTVTAGSIVLATNAYTPQLGYFRDELIPLFAHVVATEPRSPEAWAERGWGVGTSGFDDDLDRVAYGCMSEGGELVFGGGTNAAYGYRYGGRPDWKGTVDHAAVYGRFLKYMPAAADVPLAHRWTGAVALSWNRICSMGVRGEARNVYYAVGYSGHGITLANLAGRVLADLFDRQEARWADQPFFHGKMPWMPPEPLRWIGYHVATRVTGKTPRKRGVRA
jgi:gamma-glutamylputrescine oxidase